MPDKLVAMLVRFLEQNSGTLSKRALSKKFAWLKGKEVKEIEKAFMDIFEAD